MLVLSRKIMETVVIDERVTITVVAVRGGLVQLAIDAPADVQIKRLELVDRSSAEADAA